MWVANQSAEIINLNLFKIVSLEDNAIVARNGEEKHILFKDAPETCKVAFAHIAEGLATNAAMVDMKIMNP